MLTPNQKVSRVSFPYVYTILKCLIYIPQGYRVAQVRLFFRLHLLETDVSLHKERFAHVQWFSPPRRVAEKGTNMYVVSRLETDGVREGDIIPMSSISRFVQLVPKFGARAAPELTAYNSMDICRDYYVNSFGDKQIYQSVW
jgi:hypothetical protein